MYAGAGKSLSKYPEPLMSELLCWSSCKVVEGGSEVSGVSVAGCRIFHSRYHTVLGQVNKILPCQNDPVLHFCLSKSCVRGSAEGGASFPERELWPGSTCCCSGLPARCRRSAQPCRGVKTTAGGKTVSFLPLNLL